MRTSLIQKLISFVAAGIAVSLLAFFVALNLLSETYKKAASEVCELIEANYHRAKEPEVRRFLKTCREEAKAQSFLMSKTANAQRINQRLSAIRTSHLSLYSPSENRIIWDHSGHENGIRARIVEEFMIVYDVLPGSPAEDAGIKSGDVLETINGEMISSPYDARYSAGIFRVSRQGQLREVEIKLAEVKEDLSVKLRSINNQMGLLRIPSFLPGFFERESWIKTTQEFSRFQHLVIDLRDNTGGSFPAMLRAVSPFRCASRRIGTIIRPSPSDIKEGQQDETKLNDDLAVDSQLEQLRTHSRVHLDAFEDYGCFKGQVTVLMDSGTSSAAEIFAQAIFERPHSRVWGQPSAGEVVLAQWFPVTGFGGEDYSISIPIAGYRTADGIDLESRGILPEKLLYYDVEKSLQGGDSWIEDAFSNTHNVSK